MVRKRGIFRLEGLLVEGLLVFFCPLWIEGRQRYTRQHLQQIRSPQPMRPEPIGNIGMRYRDCCLCCPFT